MLRATHEAVQYLIARDEKLAKLISMVGDIEYELNDDPYLFLVSTIIGQMLSVKAADAITERLTDICNGYITAEAVSSLSDDEIRSSGMSRTKIGYIRSLASSIQNGEICFRELAELPDNEALEKLTSLRGIGMWTAKMYLIFVLDRKDILPYEDATFIQAYKWLYKARKLDAKVVERRCKKWKPYSSIAARYLYRAVDLGLTKAPNTL